MNGLFLKTLFLVFVLLGLNISAQAATWIADRNYGICSAGQPCDPEAACQAPNFLHLYDRLDTPLVCFNSAYYLRVGFNLTEPCEQGIDPETYQCIGENNCNNQTAISSPISGVTACYNQCAYDSMGGFRDYDNALSPMSYEYVPTGASCDGSEEVDLSGNADEYSDTNAQQQSCRDDGVYEVCIDAEQSCKIINGVSVCVDNQSREDFYNCGTFNGEVVCFPKNELSNCQYLNGEQFCTYSDGVKVDSDSADHPANGGNANGNNKDDFLDQADLDNNTPEAEAAKKTISDSRAKHIADKQAEIDDPSSSFSGIECDKTVSCSGDAIQCAIARIQKKQLCLSEFNQSENPANHRH